MPRPNRYIIDTANPLDGDVRVDDIFYKSTTGDQYKCTSTNPVTWTLQVTGSGGTPAPSTSQYLVGLADAALSAERVVTDTSTVTWDLSTASQAKANAVASASAGANYIALRDGAGRLFCTRYLITGTTLVAGDYALSATWGATASVGTLSGTDGAFGFTVTCAGAGILADPSTTLTFKNGTWTNVPIVVACMATGGTGAFANTLVSATATTAVITYNALPVAGLTYSFRVIVGGLG